MLDFSSLPTLDDLKSIPTWQLVLNAVLVLFPLYVVVFKRSYNPDKQGLGARAVKAVTDAEVQAALDAWQPEPLTPRAEPGLMPSKQLAAASTATPGPFIIRAYSDSGKKVTVALAGTGSDAEDATQPGAEEVTGIDAAGQDFMGLGTSKVLKDVARETMEEYTFGSCGPRGFYGTTLPHLELEDTLAEWMGTPEAISYSDSVVSVASAIPAFAKRGDLLVVDEGLSFAAATGVTLSRGVVKPFKHNDVASLESVLQGVAQRDKRGPDRSQTQRRFIIVEGLYALTGDFAPLSDIVRLANQYKFRVIVDDSLGWAAVGASGRGSLERAGLSTSDVSVLLGSLTTTAASVGGFCVGSRQVVDHQRLSGAGYCFSASSPPFLCATATAAVKYLQQNPGVVADLRAASIALHEQLQHVHAKLKSSAVAVQTAGELLAGAVAEWLPGVHVEGVLQSSVEQLRTKLTDGKPGAGASNVSDPESPVQLLYFNASVVDALLANAAVTAAGRLLLQVRLTGRLTANPYYKDQTLVFSEDLLQTESQRAVAQRVLLVTQELMEQLVDSCVREIARAGAVIAGVKLMSSPVAWSPPHLKVCARATWKRADLQAVGKAVQAGYTSATSTLAVAAAEHVGSLLQAMRTRDLDQVAQLSS